MKFEDLSGFAWLIAVLLLLWWLGGVPAKRQEGEHRQHPAPHNLPDPSYSSIDQYLEGAWDEGAIRDNSVGGRARERNRRRYNDSLYGR